MSESVDDQPGRPNQVVDLEERNWLPRHLRGDRAAFPKLLAAYQARIYSYLTRYGVAPHTRDDLFQEIFLKVHRAAASYQPSRPLRPWVFTIAANTVRNHLRGARDCAQPLEDEPTDPAPAIETRIAQHEHIEWLETAIAALPLAQREVLLLITIEALSQKEVAEILAMPVNTVKTHLRRARLSLLQAQGRRIEQSLGGAHA